MPTVNFTAEQIDPRARTVAWTPLANTDDGAGYGVFGADKSVQVTGTFGAGGTLVIEGTNDANPASATWFTLTDPQGNAMSFTAARLEQISEYTRWIRPRVTAGDGTTALTVRMYVGT
jgi:hypothetical protein